MASPRCEECGALSEAPGTCCACGEVVKRGPRPVGRIAIYLLLAVLLACLTYYGLNRRL